MWLTHPQALRRRYPATLNHLPFKGHTILWKIHTTDNRLEGGSLEGALLDNDQLTLKGTVVSGRNEEPEDYNASTLAAGHKGTIYSFQLTSRLFEEKLNLTAECSMSDFDEDTFDDIDSAIFLAAGGRRRPPLLPSLSPGCGGDV